MRKAIISGANGFMGAALCKYLTSKEIEVIAIVKNKKADTSNIIGLPKLRIVYCDFSEFKNLAEQIEDRDIDVFFHLAWVGSAGSLRGDSDVQIHNIQYTCDTVKACAALNCKRFVFASSIMKYEIEAIMATDKTPGINTLYSSAKVAADYMARTIAGTVGIEYIRAVISNVYGPGEETPRLINSSIRKLLSGEHCAFSAGEQIYDFIYITDAIGAMEAIAERGIANRTYYIGSQNPRPLKEFLCEMRDQVDPGIDIGLGEIPFDGVSLSYDEFDIYAIEKDTGFVPTIPFSEGIKNTIEWVRGCLSEKSFKLEKLELEGAYLIHNFHVGDGRGGFTKCFEKNIYAEAGIEFHLNETFVSVSAKNVVRGLHFQLHNPQAKLVCVVKGKVWDVIVDVRPNSKTYKKWIGVELSERNHCALYIPRGFAHGFVALEEDTLMLYQCDGAYDKETDTGILFNDPELGITWPIDEKDAVRSDRDRKLMSMTEYEKQPVEC